MDDLNFGITTFDDVLKQCEILSKPPQKKQTPVPYSWSFSALKNGRDNTLASIDYEYEGIDKEIALVLNENSGTDNESHYDKSVKIMDIRHKHGLVDNDLLYRTKLYLKYIYEKISDKQYETEVLKYKRDRGEITEQECDKSINTINGEPWVYVTAELDSKSPKNMGAFELDWNSYFIENLIKNGYYGKTDEEIVNDWFTELCNTVARESELENLEQEYPNRSTAPNASKTKDGKTDYS